MNVTVDDTTKQLNKKTPSVAGHAAIGGLRGVLNGAANFGILFGIIGAIVAPFVGGLPLFAAFAVSGAAIGGMFGGTVGVASGGLAGMVAGKKRKQNKQSIQSPTVNHVEKKGRSAEKINDNLELVQPTDSSINYNRSMVDLVERRRGDEAEKEVPSL